MNRRLHLASLLTLATLFTVVATGLGADVAQADVAPPPALTKVQQGWPYPTVWLPDVPYYHYSGLKVGHDRHGAAITLTFRKGARQALWHMHVLSARTSCRALYGPAKKTRQTAFGPVYYSPGSHGADAWACLADVDAKGKPLTLVFDLWAEGLTPQQMLAVVVSSPLHGWGHD